MTNQVGIPRWKFPFAFGVVASSPSSFYRSSAHRRLDRMEQREALSAVRIRAIFASGKGEGGQVPFVGNRVAGYVSARSRSKPERFSTPASNVLTDRGLTVS